MKKKYNKYTIDGIKEFAKTKNGECISNEYINNYTHLEWKCHICGNIWKASWHNIVRGRWCPKCAKNAQKNSIEDIQKIAYEHEGECLSIEYIDAKTPLLFKCKKGHIWPATPDAILNKKSWCSKCAGIEKLSIEEMHELAKLNNGLCLSTEYINNRTKLLWKCNICGYEWWATPSKIKHGTWCPKCGKTLKLNTKDVQKTAKERGGECLSLEYINNSTPMIWKCKFNHTWKAPYDKIKMGRWCPKCKDGLGERICRTVFEQLFKSKFDSSYPKWLKTTDGFQMELDGYNKKLGIAFEHNGKQHYSTKNHWIKSEYELKKRQIYDALKLNLCSLNNVKLITIPEVPGMIPINDVIQYIINQCTYNEIRLPDDYENININLNKAYRTNNSEIMLNQVKEIVKKKKGILASNHYINCKTKLLIVCNEGHLFELIPSEIKAGRWCGKCANKHITIEDAKAYAMLHNGKCLSRKYVNCKIPLKWECEYGHKFKKLLHKVKRECWCNECKKLGLKPKQITFNF